MEVLFVFFATGPLINLELVAPETDPLVPKVNKLLAVVVNSPDENVSNPLMVLAEFNVTPLLVLIVTLFKTEVLEGNSFPVVILLPFSLYITFTVEPKVGAELIKPPVLAMVAPFPKVRLAPFVKVPDVRVNLPLMVLANPSDRPEELFMVRF